MRSGGQGPTLAAAALLAAACSHRPLSIAEAGAGTATDASPATVDSRSSNADGGPGLDARPVDLSGEISASSFASLMVATICDGIDTCCRRAEMSNDPSQCIVRMQGDFAHSPDAIFNPVAAAACLAQEKAYVDRCGGDSFFNWPGVGAEPLLGACRPVFRETTPIGASCTRWDECDSSTADYVCHASDNGPGQCVLSQSWLPRLRLGDPCSVSSGHGFCYSFCETGTYCDDGGSCVPQVDSGSCADQCALACNGATSYCSPSQRICLPRHVAGSPCGSVMGDCLPNLTCLGNVCLPAVLRQCGA